MEYLYHDKLVKSYDKLLELFTNVYRSYRSYTRLVDSDMERSCYTFIKALETNIQCEKELEDFLYNKLGVKLYSSCFKYLKSQDHTEVAYKSIVELLKKLVTAEKDWKKASYSFNNKEIEYNAYIKCCQKFDEAVFNVENTFNNMLFVKNNIDLPALRA